MHHLHFEDSHLLGMCRCDKQYPSFRRITVPSSLEGYKTIVRVGGRGLVDEGRGWPETARVVEGRNVGKYSPNDTAQHLKLQQGRYENCKSHSVSCQYGMLIG